MWLLALVFLAGCASRPVIDLPTPPPFVAAERWTAQRVSDALDELQKDSPELTIAPLQDKDYAIVTDASLQRFLEYWRPMANRLVQTMPDKEDSSDCDNYATALRLLANFAAMRSGIPEPIVASVIVYHEEDFGGLPATHENHGVVLFRAASGWWVAEAQSGFAAPLAQYPNRKRLAFLTLH